MKFLESQMQELKNGHVPWCYCINDIYLTVRMAYSHQQKEIHLIPLIPSYSLLIPLILGVRKE